MNLNAVPLTCSEPPVDYASHGVACHRDSWKLGTIVEGPARFVRMCFTLDLGLRHEMDVRRVKPWEYLALQANELGVDDHIARKFGAVLESNFSDHPRAAVVVVKDDPRTDTLFGAFRMRGIEKHLGGNDAAEGSASVEAEILLIVQAEQAAGPQMRNRPSPTFPFRFCKTSTPIAPQQVQILSLTQKSVDQGYRITLAPHEVTFIKKVFFILVRALPIEVILGRFEARQADDSLARQTFLDL